MTSDDPQVSTDVTLDPDSLPSIGGAVTTSDGVGAPGISVDLFEQDELGARSAFVGSATTDADGRYEFGVPEGCYVVTFIASEGTTIEGSRWHNVGRCVEDGQTITDLDAGIDGQADASLGGTASGPGDVPVEGLKVTLFTVGADGSRSQFLGETLTDETGGYGFAVGAGCYWLVFVGDSDTSFASGRYLEAAQCLTSGQAVSDLDVEVVG